MHEEHLQNDLRKSEYTIDLFKQYRKNLGGVRYVILKEGQKLVVPRRVRELLGFSSFSFLSPMVPLYKLSRSLKLDWLIKSAILPGDYKDQIRKLDVEG
jgi:hypothetical protein